MIDIKTPFGHKLSTELDNEFRRVDREWFFKWHALGYGEEINVDRFDGGRIRAGGIQFEAGTTIELVYWEAVARYVRNKINEAFDRIENEVRITKQNQIAGIAEDAALVLNHYFSRVLKRAIQTDRLLKGRGYPDKKYTAPNSSKVCYAAEIERRKSVLIGFYISTNASGWNQVFEKFVENNKGKLQILGAIVATLTILKFLGLL